MFYHIHVYIVIYYVHLTCCKLTHFYHSCHTIVHLHRWAFLCILFSHPFWYPSLLYCLLILFDVAHLFIFILHWLPHTIVHLHLSFSLNPVFTQLLIPSLLYCLLILFDVACPFTLSSNGCPPRDLRILTNLHPLFSCSWLVTCSQTPLLSLFVFPAPPAHPICCHIYL